MTYAHALLRLRGLVLAQNALDEAVAQATEDVVTAAANEAPVVPARGSFPQANNAFIHNSLDNLAVPSARGPVPTRASSPMESSVRPKHEVVQTRMSTKKVGSADVERYIREIWAKATDEAGRVHARNTLHTSIESGVLDADARERLLQLTTIAKIA